MASERLQLEYLGRSSKPLWGAHLSRNEPVTDGDMKRWIDNGWIAVDKDRRGYVLTDLGRSVLPTLR
jgi:hypothetical protein